MTHWQTLCGEITLRLERGSLWFLEAIRKRPNDELQLRAADLGDCCGYKQLVDKKTSVLQNSTFPMSSNSYQRLQSLYFIESGPQTRFWLFAFVMS